MVDEERIMKNEEPASPFIDLMTYEKYLTPASTVRRSNLIKGAQIACSGAQTIDVESHDAKQPTIITHRDGDTITGIEFICPCGLSTLVSLEY